jgi:hypothetical protein
MFVRVSLTGDRRAKSSAMLSKAVGLRRELMDPQSIVVSVAMSTWRESLVVLQDEEAREVASDIQ